MPETKPQPASKSDGGAARTLGEAAESSRESYHDNAQGASKGRPGRHDPNVGKSGDKNVEQH